MEAVSRAVGDRVETNVVEIDVCIRSLGKSQFDS